MVVILAGGARARVKEVKILDVDVDHLEEKPLVKGSNLRLTLEFSCLKI